MKKVYVIQPYEVGTTKYKCLAMIIPSKVAKSCGIDTSSIFSLRFDLRTKQIHLRGPSNVTDIGYDMKKKSDLANFDDHNKKSSNLFVRGDGK